MSVIKIGDQFKEYLFSDKRDSNGSDVKIGIIKSFYRRGGEEDIALVVFEKRGQSKVRTEISVSNLKKVEDFWIRK